MDSLNNECSVCAQLRRLKQEHERVAHSSDNPVRRTEESAPIVNGSEEIRPEKPNNGRTLKDIERAHIERIFKETGRNLSRTAKILDIDRGTLYSKLKRYGLK